MPSRRTTPISPVSKNYNIKNYLSYFMSSVIQFNFILWLHSARRYNPKINVNVNLIINYVYQAKMKWSGEKNNFSVRQNNRWSVIKTYSSNCWWVGAAPRPVTDLSLPVLWLDTVQHFFHMCFGTVEFSRLWSTNQNTQQLVLVKFTHPTVIVTIISINFFHRALFNEEKS